MERVDVQTLQRELDILKKAVIEIKAKMIDLDMINAILMSHRHGPDPEGELSDFAKKSLKEARQTPDEEYIDMEEIEQEFLCQK